MARKRGTYCTVSGRSFFVQLVVAFHHFVEISGARAFLGTAHLALTGIVGGDGRGPVAKVPVQFLEIVGGGFGSAIGVQAFVQPPVLGQAVLHAGIGHELPGAQGPHTGFRIRTVAALNQGQIGQLFGHAARAEDLAGITQIGLGIAGKDAHGPAPLAQEVLVLQDHVRHGGLVDVTVDAGRVLEGGQFRGGQRLAALVAGDDEGRHGKGLSFFLFAAAAARQQQTEGQNTKHPQTCAAPAGQIRKEHAYSRAPGLPCAGKLRTQKRIGTSSRSLPVTTPPIMETP